LNARAIVNLQAGVAARRALRALEGRGAFWSDLEITLTRHTGHARELAREAAERGDCTVLAVGGDGTANEVAWGILGSETALGLVPAGSGNGLARGIGLPLDPARALLALEQSVVRRMDVGFVNDRPFLNVAGVGFDAAVGAAFHERSRGGARRGVLGYVRAGLALAFAYRVEPLTIEGTESPLPSRALLLTVANGAQYGGGAIIAPGARLDDGRLDVIVIEDGPRLPLLFHAPRLFTGGIEAIRRYQRSTATSLVVSAAAPLPHHRDGEPELACTRLEIRLEPRALRLLVPKATAENPKGPFLPE